MGHANPSRREPSRSIAAVASPTLDPGACPTVVDNVEKLVKEFALEVGFDLVGIASADPFEDHRDVTLQRIRKGLMDGLPWFTEARVNRGSNPEELLPGARSIISVG